ncbi:hypothetical protein MPH_06127 [Macrophomina phaseolina MS6]|uniref:Uncharacterized protein n=1 Tax=Macrophomina phaseolina (strain MS6) TaxID=1126212 RepID=K2RPJ7_MACPH|nr:hypothetical protein MPH_06127 [Macrophomina phaseolina MS6]
MEWTIHAVQRHWTWIHALSDSHVRLTPVVRCVAMCCSGRKRSNAGIGLARDMYAALAKQRVLRRIIFWPDTTRSACSQHCNRRSIVSCASGSASSATERGCQSFVDLLNWNITSCYANDYCCFRHPLSPSC